MNAVIPDRFPVTIQWHYDYILGILRDAGVSVSTIKRDSMVVTLDGKDVFFDMGDSSAIVRYPSMPVLKFHHRDPNSPGIKPFTPISFLDWQEYRSIRAMGLYRPERAKLVSSRQIPYANAITRRRATQALLRAHYGSQLVTEQLPSQHDYFLDIANIKASVCVGGYCANMLDRGQLQYMALGVCTVSSNIPDLLPYGRRLIPGVHYLRCKEDYSDAAQILDAKTPEELAAIGRNAQELFDQTSTPRKLVDWIAKNAM